MISTIRSINRAIFHILFFTTTSTFILPSYRQNSSQSALPYSTERSLQVKDEMIKSLQFRRYEKALSIHQENHEILDSIATEQMVQESGVFKTNQAEATVSQLQIISAFIEKNENLCSLLPSNSCKLLCDFANKNPQGNLSLLKKLTKFIIQKNTLNSYQALCSILTNHRLPKYLMDELLEQMPYDENSPSKPNRISICTHPAIRHIEERPYVELDSNNLKVQDPSVLSIILHCSSPDRCMQKVKTALTKVAGISEETIENAKFYNPNCLLFLLQYKSWFPKFYANFFSIQSYSNIVSAYNHFIIKNDPIHLIRILKPNNRSQLDPLTLRVRACFSGEKKLNKTNCSYAEERNRTFLYQELLPMLQSLENIQFKDVIEFYDNDLVDAIKDKNHDKISEIIQRYNPNYYYVGTKHPEFYGTPPLFIAITLHDPVATEIFLQKISPLTPLHPAWHPTHSAAYFAMRACMSRYNQYIASKKQIKIFQEMQEHDEITEILDPKTIFDLDEAISCQNYAKSHEIEISTPLVEIEKTLYKKSLETLKVVLDYTNFNDLEQPETKLGPTISKYLLETIILFIKSINNNIAKTNQEALRNLQLTDSINTEEIELIDSTDLLGIEILETLFDLGISPNESISTNLSIERFANQQGLPLLAEFIKKYKDDHSQFDDLSQNT